MTKEKQNYNMLISVLAHTYEQIVLVDNDGEKGQILNQGENSPIASYDEWCESYFGKCYAGDDRRLFLQKIQQEAILDKLTYDDEYVVEFSALEKGRARRKQLKAFTCQKEAVLCICILDVTSTYLKSETTEQMMRKCLEIAQDANMAREHFLKEMQQELRGPLYGMDGMLEAALLAEPEQKVEYVRKAKNALGQYSAMVEKMLSMSVIEKGQLERQEKVVLVDSLTERVMLLATDKAAERNVSVRLVNDNQKITAIETDPVLCRQLMFGALELLMDHSAAGDEVTANVDFDIQNTVQEEKQVFDFVFTVTSKAVFGEEIMEQKRQMVMLMQRITDHMDGVMTMGTEADATTISFRIPVQRAERIDEKDADAVMHLIENTSERDFSDYRALVVDDEPIRREVTVAKLERLGLSVDTADDGQEALDMLTASPVNYYQIMFMNPILPNKTGLEATMELREMERNDINDITVVALTSNDLRDERIRSLEHGMDYHIPLPLDEIELKEILIRELQDIAPREEHEIFGFRVLK